MTNHQATMRAMQQAEWGLEMLKLVDVPRPEPLPTEVLVRVKAVGVNLVDHHTVFGRGYMNALSLPHIPGWDIAGVVEQIGYGATRFKIGDEVFGLPRFPRAAGGFAEYITAPARQLALKPTAISFEQAAGVALSGLTAWQMLVDAGKVGPGTKVLINGAAGAVGHFAVQVAKSLGAFVIAVARKETHEFLKGLGADRLIDYTTSVVADEVKDADVVIELVGGDTCIQMLKTPRKGGLLVSARNFPNIAEIKEAASKLDVHGSWFMVEPDYVGLDQLAALIQRGSLKVEISHVFPLERAVEALETIGRGAAGKTVIKVS